jgi:23S rRNA pseudouridine2605 synthase
LKKRTDNFDKFLPGKKNAAIKEQFKQEKKKWKKERSAAIELQKQRKAEADKPKPIVIRKKQSNELMPLNKYIAHCGVCARREAALLVKDGKVMVNGEKVTEPGHKVGPNDQVKVNGKQIHLALNLVYILLNKPKDYITTSADPEGRKTVFELIKGATKERVYPVGRLDRNTTGVLLMTNDGELTQMLSHPSNEVRKVYEVRLDRPLLKKDMDEIAKGITLEDGFIRPDAIAYADPKDKRVIGIEIHSGKNRIVRRIFEQLEYKVANLDRVMFAGLTKKNVERNKWRYLTEKEVRALKYFGASKKTNKKKDEDKDA